VVVGARVKGAALIDLLAEQRQAELLCILHDALVGILQGLDELIVDTAVGSWLREFPFSLRLMQELVIILQRLLDRLDILHPHNQLLPLRRQLVYLLWCWHNSWLTYCP
jgi:hypothetical protein